MGVQKHLGEVRQHEGVLHRCRSKFEDRMQSNLKKKYKNMNFFSPNFFFVNSYLHRIEFWVGHWHRWCKRLGLQAREILGRARICKKICKNCGTTAKIAHFVTHRLATAFGGNSSGEGHLNPTTVSLNPWQS